MTKYIKKIEKGNYIYFECSKRKKGCKRKCKFQIKEKKWFLVEKCNDILFMIFTIMNNLKQIIIIRILVIIIWKTKNIKIYYTRKIMNDNFNIKSYNKYMQMNLIQNLN